jgi:hypothetical protein
VRLDIGHVPGVGDLAVMWPSAIVRFGLDDVSLVAEDGLVSRRGVHDHRIWAVAEDMSFWEALARPISSLVLAGLTILLLQSQ